MDKASPQRKKPGWVFLYMWIVQSSYLYGTQPAGPGRANVPPTHWGRDFGQTPLHALPVRHPRASHLDAYWRQKDKTKKHPTTSKPGHINHVQPTPDFQYQSRKRKIFGCGSLTGSQRPSRNCKGKTHPVEMLPEKEKRKTGQLTASLKEKSYLSPFYKLRAERQSSWG